MPNLIEQLIDEPELSPVEQAAVDKFARLKDQRIEEVVMYRMLDPEYVVDAILTCLQDNVSTQKHFADLIMGHGDKLINIANLRLDVLDWIAFKVRQDAERGVL